MMLYYSHSSTSSISASTIGYYDSVRVYPNAMRSLVSSLGTLLQCLPIANEYHHLLSRRHYWLLARTSVALGTDH
jgi:hypothetical protein